MKLFTAGPVNLSDYVKKVWAQEEIGHREVEFTNIFKGIKKKLMKLFKVNTKEYDVAIIGGSGTAAVESVLSSVIDNKGVLILNNGAFGDRMVEICNHHNIETLDLDNAWGQKLDLELIEDLIKDHDTNFVAMVHMETSTGMLNPVHEIGMLCKKYDKKFIVDSISAFGGEEIDVRKDNIDFLITNTNKCLCSVPVLGIVCCKIQSLRDCVSALTNPRTFSLSLVKHLYYGERNQTPFTPAIPLYVILDKALDDLIKETIPRRIKRFKNLNKLLLTELKKLGLYFQLDEKDMSSLMVNVLLPDNIKFETIHKHLRGKGIIIYPGKDKLNGKIMHIANMGNLRDSDVMELIKELKVVLNK